MIKRLIRRTMLPAAVSAGLIGWLLYLIPPDRLFEELARLPARSILPLTAAMIAALYLWDTVCLQTVFAADDHVVPYRSMLRLRGESYLLGAFNYELGQGIVAWNISRFQDIKLLSALSRSVVLAFHDLTVLLSVGLVGSLLVTDPPRQVVAVRIISAVGLSGLIGLAVFFALLPAATRERVQHTRWGVWLIDWSWPRSSKLAWQRLVYFGILITYGGIALYLCGIPVDSLVVISTLPVALLADALPSVSGIGTREAALILLLDPENRAVLFAFSLVWSTGMVAGRLIIGLLWLWVPRHWFAQTEIKRAADRLDEDAAHPDEQSGSQA